jgi:hypothetical protein
MFAIIALLVTESDSTYYHRKVRFINTQIEALDYAMGSIFGKDDNPVLPTLASLNSIKRVELVMGVRIIVKTKRQIRDCSGKWSS